MSKLVTKIKTDAIFRFWITQMAIFLLALVICILGFRRTLSIVEQSTLRDSRNLLRQGVSEIETTLENMHRLGLEVSNSEPVLSLSQSTPDDGTAYYRAVQAALNDLMTSGSYYDPDMTQRCFLYLSSIDRVLYNGAAYGKSVFQQYPDKWDIAMEEWLSACISDARTPFFQPTESGSALYVFPCRSGKFATEKPGAMTFLIGNEFFSEKMPFLSEYSAYTLLVYEDGQQIFACDGLQCAEELAERWQAQPESMVLDGRLALQISTGNTARDYLLVLPQKEAMLGLQQLSTTIFVLLGIAILLEAALTFFFSLRNGRPINAIATALHKEDETAVYSTDLRDLNARIEQELEEKRLDRPALQTSFFHDLLKASFVSTAEMKWQAQRAGLELQGNSYCAASLRLFPNIEPWSVEGRTVATANALQEMMERKLEELYSGRFWTYRHNVMVGLYIFENINGTDWDGLLQTLTETVRWLERESQISVCWGVGTPYNDLMQLWKSVEEANSMLDMEGVNSKVRLYLDAPRESDPYYLPYSVEESLVKGLRSGSSSEVSHSMELIQEENLTQRTLNLKQLQELNHRISGILREQIKRLAYNESLFHMVNDLETACQDGTAEYFIQARFLCSAICQESAREKNTQRSDRIRAILNFIQTEYGNPELGLTLVGDRFGISEAYLSTVFKAEVGSNFADYLEQVRIQAACQLLQEGALVSQVATDTGYSSVQSFRRAFKRVMGVSPSSYRT